jgi:hypothetical protein
VSQSIPIPDKAEVVELLEEPLVELVASTAKDTLQTINKIINTLAKVFIIFIIKHLKLKVNFKNNKKIKN